MDTMHLMHIQKSPGDLACYLSSCPLSNPHILPTSWVLKSNEPLLKMIEIKQRSPSFQVIDSRHPLLFIFYKGEHILVNKKHLIHTSCNFCCWVLEQIVPEDKILLQQQLFSRQGVSLLHPFFCDIKFW